MMGIGVIAVLSLTVFLTALVISGFIATYFTKEKNLQYGFYEGILIILVGLFDQIFTSGLSFIHQQGFFLVFLNITVLLLAVLGG